MRRYTITVNDDTKVIDVEAIGANSFRVQIDGRAVDVELTDHRDMAHGSITPVVQTRALSAPPAGVGAAPAPRVAPDPVTDAGPARPAAAPSAAPAPAAGAGSAQDKLTAPMPGVILSIDTSVGTPVKRGDTLLVLEAMKMKNELKAPRDGVVAEIYPSVGQQVRYGEFLVRFEES